MTELVTAPNTYRGLRYWVSCDETGFFYCVEHYPSIPIRSSSGWASVEEAATQAKVLINRFLDIYSQGKS